MLTWVAVRAYRRPHSPEPVGGFPMIRWFLCLLVASWGLSGTARAADERPPPEERTFFRPLRVGLCGGYGIDCSWASYRVEVSGRWVGVGANALLIPIESGAHVKAFFLPPQHTAQLSWRPYGFAGRIWSINAQRGTGGGLGADVHLTSSKMLLLQPSVSMWEWRRRQIFLR